MNSALAFVASTTATAIPLNSRRARTNVVRNTIPQVYRIPPFCSDAHSNSGFGRDCSNEDWRAFRARLVCTEHDGPQQNLWAHPVSFIEPGSLLLASPRHFTEEHASTFFANTGILILHHSENDGTVGVVINRPISAQMKSQVSIAPMGTMHFSDNSSFDDLFACDDAPVFLGGPVGLESLSVLHGDTSFGHPVTGAVRSGEFAAAFQQYQTGKLVHARFFLGYAGWRKGQLQMEVNDGVWFICSACDELVLRKWQNGTQMHKVILPLMGGTYAEIASEIGDEESNRDEERDE